MINKFNIFILVLFVILNIAFNYKLWFDVITPPSSSVYVDDGIITQYILENSYNNIRHGSNPYKEADTLFYPFSVNFSMSDPAVGAVFVYGLFRTALDPYRAMVLTSLLGFFFASIFMYIVLFRLNINKYLAFIYSLVFTYTPFMSHQLLGHYTYLFTYFFPLLFLCAYEFINAASVQKKVVWSILFGFFSGFLLLTNFQYFLIEVIAVVSSVIFFLYMQKKEFLVRLRRDAPFIFLSGTVFLIILTPWIIKVRELAKFEGTVPVHGLGGAPELSTDVVSLIMPSEFNPLYTFFLKTNTFFSRNINTFGYVGFLVLLPCVYLVIQKIRHNSFINAIGKKLTLFLALTGIFAILMLGPFLKIAGQWMIALEGIPVMLPFPFLGLHFIPGLESLRVPSRFLIAATFFGTITATIFLNEILKRKNIKFQKIFILILFLVFAVDQMYVIPQRIRTEIPLKVYKYIKKDPARMTVLEIPFTARDGFLYVGFVHALTPMDGILYHEKPIIGGYIARVHPEVFRYYRDLPFLGYISSIIDKGNYDPYKDAPKQPLITPYMSTLEEAKREMDFLNIVYIVLKKNEIYYVPIKKLLGEIGYTYIMTDSDYELYKRTPRKTHLATIHFGIDDQLYIGYGFSDPEKSQRWVEGTFASVFIQTFDTGPQTLMFSAASLYKPQQVEVFINKKSLGIVNVSTDQHRYVLNTKNTLKNGINTISFNMRKTYKPYQVIPGSLDPRNLSVKFMSLSIQKI